MSNLSVLIERARIALMARPGRIQFKRIKTRLGGHKWALGVGDSQRDMMRGNGRVRAMERTMRAAVEAVERRAGGAL